MKNIFSKNERMTEVKGGVFTNDQITFSGSNDDLFVRETVNRQLGKNTVINVPETHVAILVKNAKMMDTLESGIYPIYDIKGFSFDAKQVTSLDIIYMSKTAKLNMIWGTRTRLMSRDIQTGVPVSIGANGEMEVRIGNPRQFYLELVGVDKDFSIRHLQERLVNKIINALEPVLLKTLRINQISYDRIGEYKRDIGLQLKEDLNREFMDSYGVTVCSFTIVDVNLDEEGRRAVEAEFAEQRMRAKARMQKNEDEEDYRKIVADIERLDDKNWERQQYLLQLKDTNYGAYLEVCKKIGWEPEGVNVYNGNVNGATVFCSRCGTSNNANTAFCKKCGNAINGVAAARVCPVCGRRVEDGGALFCNYCGTKL